MTEEYVLPKGWQIKKLSEVCDINTGDSINPDVKKKKYTNLNDGYNYIGTKDISIEGIINYENGVKIPFNEKGFNIAHPDTTLLCIEGGSAGKKIGITKQTVCYGNKLCAFKCLPFVNPLFMYYFLQTDIFLMNFYNRLTGLIGGVSVGKVRKIFFPFPSFSEQTRIVKKIDNIFQKIEKQKSNLAKNITNAKELYKCEIKKKYLKENEWQSTTLGSLIELRYGKALSKSERSVDGKYLVYGANGPLAKTDKFMYSKKTIIIGRKGSAGELNYSEEKFWATDVTYYVVFNEKVLDLKFLYTLLLLQNLPTLAKGVKPGINRNDVYSIKVKIPSLPEQQKIVARLDKLKEKTDALVSRYQQKIKLLEELKYTVLNQAFKGEL